jgi:hypothetical protein
MRAKTCAQLPSEGRKNASVPIQIKASTQAGIVMYGGGAQEVVGGCRDLLIALGSRAFLSLPLSLVLLVIFRPCLPPQFCRSHSVWWRGTRSP